MRKHLSKTRIIFLILFSVILIVSITWGIHHHMLFGKYENITFDYSVPGAKISYKDNLTFSVSKTRYLDFGGNLGIVDAENGRYLIVWPSLFNDNTYGFMMTDTEQTYNFLIDLKGNLLNKDDFPYTVQLIYDNNKIHAIYLLEQFSQWSKAAEKDDRSFFETDNL